MTRVFKRHLTSFAIWDLISPLHGHLGDGNIHFNLSQPAGADTAAFLAEWDAMNRLVHDIVARMGGSFSAEHGIGRMRRGELERYKPAVE